MPLCQHRCHQAIHNYSIHLSQPQLDYDILPASANGRTHKILRSPWLSLLPTGWHYDILGELKIFSEIDRTEDARIEDALDLLEEMALPSGVWPAEGRYYKKVSGDYSLNADYVDWGGTSKRRLNAWVTADALYVLKCFGRLNI